MPSISDSTSHSLGCRSSVGPSGESGTSAGITPIPAILFSSVLHSSTRRAASISRLSVGTRTPTLPFWTAGLSSKRK